MKYANVIFPLKLRPLTYLVPIDIQSDLKGRVVNAPLMGKGHYGVVTGVFNSIDIFGGTTKKIKQISSIFGHFGSDKTIHLLKWLSDYYLAPMGSALKSSFFEEAAALIIKKDEDVMEFLAAKKSSALKPWQSDSPIAPVCSSIAEKKYSTFLCHASSPSDEKTALLKTLNLMKSNINGAIILVPEISLIEQTTPALREIFGERLCLLHSRLAKRKRKDSVERLLSGQSDVVIGTRSAVLAPLQNVSFIAVLGEHSPSYKGEEGLRYNARDVAVMRGFLENSTVLLSSICPAFESVHNARIGKYIFLDAGGQKTVEIDSQDKPKQPKIRIINSPESRQKNLYISAEILKAAEKTLSDEGRFLFLSGRKGYSLMCCDDCKSLISCDKCKTPLIFHKNINALRCHYCGDEKRVPQSCDSCKGFSIKSLSAGTERIKEEIEKRVKTEAIIIEKTDLKHKNAKSDSGVNALMPDDFTSFVIGTAYAAKRLKNELFDAAALFNIDAIISQPDFRAYERAFQEVIQISHMVKSAGSVFIQTWQPRNRLFSYIKGRDFRNFYEYEIEQRKTLDYPPFSRIILFNILIKGNVPDLAPYVKKITGDALAEGLEILGPVETPAMIKSRYSRIQILLKSRDRKILHSAGEKILSKLEQIKGIKVSVDVDPLRI